MTGKGSGKGAGKPDLQAFLATLTWLTTLAGMEETAEAPFSSSQQDPNRGTSEATSSSSQQEPNRGTSEATSSSLQHEPIGGHLSSNSGLGPEVPEPEVEPGKPRLAPDAPEHEVKMEHGKMRGTPYWKVLGDQGYCKWILQHISATSSAPMQDLLAYVKDYYKLVPTPRGRGSSLEPINPLPTSAQHEMGTNPAAQNPGSVASNHMSPMCYEDIWKAARIMSVVTPQMLQTAALRLLREGESRRPEMEQMIDVVEIVAQYHSAWRQ